MEFVISLIHIVVFINITRGNKVLNSTRKLDAKINGSSKVLHDPFNNNPMGLTRCFRILGTFSNSIIDVIPGQNHGIHKTTNNLLVGSCKFVVIFTIGRSQFFALVNRSGDRVRAQYSKSLKDICYIATMMKNNVCRVVMRTDEDEDEDEDNGSWVVRDLDAL
jgi:hypothetical protein